METVDIINIETQAAQTSIADLRKELKQLKEQMLSSQEGTEEYNSALQRAAEIQHNLSETNQRVSASAADVGQVLQNVTKVTGGLMSGFQAATAAMNLMGVENEDVIKSMQKMQNIMALTQALPGLEAGIKAFKTLGTVIKTQVAGAFKTLRGAIISTGVGALVVAVGTLIAYWDEFCEMIGVSKDDMTALGEIGAGVMSVITNYLKSMIDYWKAFFTLDFKGMWDALKQGFSGVEAFQKGVQEKQIKNAEDLAKKQIDIDLERNKRSLQSTANRIETEIELEKKRLLQYKEGTLEYEKQLTKIDNLEKSLTKELESESEKRKQAIEKAQKARIAGYELEFLKAKNAREESRQALESSLKINEQSLSNYTKNSEEYIALMEFISDQRVALHKLDIDDAKLRLDIDSQILTTLKKGTKEYEDQLSKMLASKRAYEEILNEEIENKPKENNQENVLKLQLDIELAQLEESYNRGLQSEEEYLALKESLERRYLDNYLSLLEKQLEAEDLTAEQRLNIIKNLSEARADIAAIDNQNLEEGDSRIRETFSGINQSLQEFANYVDTTTDSPAWGNMVSKIGLISEEIGSMAADGKASVEGILNVTELALGGMGDMFTALSDEEDKSTKEGFEQAKKYQIAASTMNMLAGIVSAWTSAMSPANAYLTMPGQIAMGSAMSTLILATGLMQIKKIKDTQFEGGSTSGGGSSPTLTTVQAPIQYTQDVQGAQLQQTIADTRVYVVESDITNAQERVEVSETESRY